MNFLYFTQKQASQKIFLINKVLYEIFKRNTNINKTLLRTPELITSTITTSRAKMKWKEHGKKKCKLQMLIKDLQPSQQWLNMKKISLITEQKILSSLIIPLLFSKMLEVKFLHQNAIIQNEKPQRAVKWYYRPAIMRIFLVISIQKQSPGGVL